MTNPKHTSSDLVERLRGDWPEILVEKHWMMDSDAIDKQREEAADRIEALEAEVERLTARVAELEAGLDEAIDQLWHLSKDGDDNYLVRQLQSIRRAALEARHD